jgi:hypothetical protein
VCGFCLLMIELLQPSAGDNSPSHSFSPLAITHSLTLSGIEKEKSLLFHAGFRGSLLPRQNRKLQVRRMCAARVEDMLPPVGADVLFDRRHERSQKVS